MLADRFIEKHYLNPVHRGIINLRFKNLNRNTKNKLRKMILKEMQPFLNYFDSEIKYRFVRTESFSNSHKKKNTYIHVEFFDYKTGYSYGLPNYRVGGNVEYGNFKGHVPTKTQMSGFKNMSRELLALKAKINHYKGIYHTLIAKIV